MRLVSRDANDVYEIGNKIREAREAQGMSQDDLADVMGTSRNAISRHEIGQAEIRETTIHRSSWTKRTTACPTATSGCWIISTAPTCLE